MSDFFDYLNWRGDLSFEQSPFNSVDALILCQISYLDFSGIVSDKLDEYILLSELAEEFRNNDFERRCDTGLLINPRTAELFLETAAVRRFSDIKVCCYRNNYKPDIEEQFCAVTYYPGDGSAFVAFRGTDDTIIGWKEDFNLAFKSEVPAQKDALEYLSDVASVSRKCALRVAGHSKGGNLAIYASAKLNNKLKKNLIEIYNFDGPGFSKAVLDLPEFKDVEDRILSFYPQFSIVGMLFFHYPEYKVVISDGMNIAQHDPFLWHLDAVQPCFKDSLDDASLYFFQSFNDWFVVLEESKRKEFVETLFSVLGATDAKTNSELADDWLKNAGKIVKALAELDPDIRKSAVHSLSLLFKTAGNNLPELFDKIIRK